MAHQTVAQCSALKNLPALRPKRSSTMLRKLAGGWKVSRCWARYLLFGARSGVVWNTGAASRFSNNFLQWRATLHSTPKRKLLVALSDETSTERPQFVPRPGSMEEPSSSNFHAPSPSRQYRQSLMFAIP